MARLMKRNKFKDWSQYVTGNSIFGRTFDIRLGYLVQKGQQQQRKIEAGQAESVHLLYLRRMSPTSPDFGSCVRFLILEHNTFRGHDIFQWISCD